MPNELMETIKVHDKYQFEMKFTYPLDREKKKNEYHIETFIFIPGNLCINPQSYTDRDFYNDLQKYIRLKTPEFVLSGIHGAPQSPLAKLETSMRNLTDGSAPENGDSLRKTYEERIKMFCSIMKSAMRDEEAFLERSLDPGEQERQIQEYLDETAGIIAEFRQLKPLLLSPLIKDRERSLFAFVDEFLSITANKYRYRLFQYLSGRDEPWVPEIRRKFIREIRSEIRHRRACGYPSVPNRLSDNEELIFREGVLKKLMASVLFLRTQTHRDGVMVQNFAFSLAAGCAMSFAAAITFMTTGLFQDFSALFFLVLVLSYVFKDRIKDLGKNYFYAKMKPLLYDYKTNIFCSLGQKVGVCRESFSFLNKRKLPPEVVRIRNRDLIADLGNEFSEEEIMFSRKHIVLYTEPAQKIFTDFRVNGIVDILRFNVSRFLEKMDNPLKEILMPEDDSDDTLIRVKAKCVYHVNMVLRYGLVGGELHYKRLRIVLSRNGIKRIEEVRL